MVENNYGTQKKYKISSWPNVYAIRNITLVEPTTKDHLQSYKISFHNNYDVI